MNVLLGVFAIISMVYCIHKFKEITRQVSTEKISVSITSESLLFFVSLFEIIRLAIYIIH